VARKDLWWLHEGNRALRLSDWKLVARRDGPWELYDLKHDRGEQRDLASKRPETVRELESLWKVREAEFNKLATSDQAAAK
jgi:arylsulfatase